MSSLAEVIFYSLIGGAFSLVGGFLLLSDKKRALKLAAYATPFAAGALLAAAFFDLLPEAGHQGDSERALTFTLIGILGFFLLERFLRVFHHHHEHDKKDKKSDPTSSLIVIGDTLHNFVDGIAIAAGFLIDSSTGIVVTAAVAAHEIPQEIGDFGLLLKKGMSRKNVMLVNLVSALATTVAAVIFYQLGSSNDISLDVVLGLVAGFFIYIAVSDIIPSIHAKEDKQIAGPQTLLLLVGVVVVGFATTTLHEYIDRGHEHDSHGHSEHEEHGHGDENHDDEHAAEEHADEKHTDEKHSEEEHAHEGEEHGEEEHHDEGEEHSDEDHSTETQ